MPRIRRQILTRTKKGKARSFASKSKSGTMFGKYHKFIARKIARKATSFSFNPMECIRDATRQFKATQPIPPWKSFSLRYAEAFPAAGLSVGVAGVGGTELLYGLNSLFDPNQSGVGHQPYYYDQMVNCGYQRYRVDRVEVKITVSNPNNTDTGLMVQVDAWNGSAGTLTGVSWNTGKERPNTTWVKPVASESLRELIFEINCAEVQGMTQAEYEASDSFNAQVTASPARIPYLRLSPMNIAGGNNGTLWGSVEMVFHGKFFDRQIVAAS